MLFCIDRARSRSKVAVPASAKSSSSPTSPVRSDCVVWKDSCSISVSFDSRSRRSCSSCVRIAASCFASKCAGRLLRSLGGGSGAGRTRGGFAGFPAAAWARERSAPVRGLSVVDFFAAGFVVAGFATDFLAAARVALCFFALVFLEVVFFRPAGFRAVVFLAVVLLLVVFLAAAFLAVLFLAVVFFVVDFRAGFLAAVFLTVFLVVFLAEDRLAVAFFFLEDADDELVFRVDGFRAGLMGAGR